MVNTSPAFTFGIEEEYLLVDRATRDLVREMPEEMFETAKALLGPQVAREFLRAQIEVGTRVHTSFAEAAQDFTGVGFYELLQGHPIAQVVIFIAVFVGILFYVIPGLIAFGIGQGARRPPGP